jgi:hypothetical protein
MFLKRAAFDVFPEMKANIIRADVKVLRTCEVVNLK